MVFFFSYLQPQVLAFETAVGRLTGFAMKSVIKVPGGSVPVIGEESLQQAKRSREGNGNIM